MSVLFPDRSAALAELREDRLSGPLFSRSTFSMTHLERLLAAAEGDAERQLRVFFGLVPVLPANATDEERAALEAAGTRWVADPGYDFEPGLLAGDRWGLLALRYRPIHAVQRVEFVYPQPQETVFRVPDTWVQVDRHAGTLNLVPISGGLMLPAASAALLPLMGWGRNIPHLIQIRYTAGLADPARDYPELPDLVLQMAAVRALKSLILPGSGSVSADGLSQSRNVAIADYQGDIDARLAALRQAMHGVLMTCL
jgi:hypothetical protein